MEIQPVTAKVQAAYPMLAKAAFTAVAAASLVSASYAQEEQEISGVPAPPPSQTGENDSTAPAPAENPKGRPVRDDAPDPDPQDIGGEAPQYVEEQDLGGDVADDD